MGFDPADLQRLSIQFVPFIMAVVFHEYAHGFIAHHWGDDTAKEQGRLTLNPVPHMDFFGTLVIPLFMMASGINVLFGWAKPVPIDPRRFRRFRLGLFWVSLAGVGMNVLLAFLSAIGLCAVLLWVPPDFYLFEPLKQMMSVSISLNYALAIFNLIPIPPLDGSKVIESVLPFNAARKFEQLSRYGFFILLALTMTRAIAVLLYPIQFLSEWTLLLVANAFGGAGHMLGL